jgi:hypothetical protein
MTGSKVLIWRHKVPWSPCESATDGGAGLGLGVTADTSDEAKLAPLLEPDVCSPPTGAISEGRVEFLATTRSVIRDTPTWVS